MSQESDGDVTDGGAAGNVVIVHPRTELLTKRRAVDFCRVATALCRAS
ncbi:putative leader peptide [Spongiactinospora sp. TRM90649]